MFEEILNNQENSRSILLIGINDKLLKYDIL